MKAVEINKTGGPEVLEIKEISLDQPGPEQVTIEHKAIGLNFLVYLLLLLNLVSIFQQQLMFSKFWD